MLELSEEQKAILSSHGHQLIIGGPGSGKTTVSILKAEQIADTSLRIGQHILFLSFSRSSVSRVLEAIEEHSAISPETRKVIEVETYHSFFWRVIKTHGYLLGLPRKLSILAPPAEAIALSFIRNEYDAESKLNVTKKNEKRMREKEEQTRLAIEHGRVCFDLFSEYVSALFYRSNKIRKLYSLAFPFIILDEFQDTSAKQWSVLKALGLESTLIALADPEQRIFDFIGADPERLNHFRTTFSPMEHDLSNANYRSMGTDITQFGADILEGVFQESYSGITLVKFPVNHNQAFFLLKCYTLQARTRLVDSGKKNWSLAVLVPTKKMMHKVSDYFMTRQSSMATIKHHAAIDMHGAILAVELLTFLLQPKTADDFSQFVEFLCNFFQGRDGDTPLRKNIKESMRIKNAFDKALECKKSGKDISKISIMRLILAGYEVARKVVFTGDPDVDLSAINLALERCDSSQLKQVVDEAKNIRFLDRGSQLRMSLSQTWRDHGAYINSVDIVRKSFIQEHFSTSTKPEKGVVIMNMHKAKGKQFDEVIIFEGWPKVVKGRVVDNSDRIVRGNSREQDLNHYRFNFRVSITRAKTHTTILTPDSDPCILLLNWLSFKKGK